MGWAKVWPTAWGDVRAARLVHLCDRAYTHCDDAAGRQSHCLAAPRWHDRAPPSEHLRLLSHSTGPVRHLSVAREDADEQTLGRCHDGFLETSLTQLLDEPPRVDASPDGAGTWFHHLLNEPVRLRRLRAPLARVRCRCPRSPDNVRSRRRASNADRDSAIGHPERSHSTLEPFLRAMRRLRRLRRTRARCFLRLA